MIVKSALKSYSVEMIDSFPKNLNQDHSDKNYYVIDENVYRLYSEAFDFIPSDRLYRLEAVEENKNIDTAIKICETMTSMPSKRNTRLVSVGGGIVQDVSGFVASVLYRGIAWTFYPSTLLAACDSCIGSKTSLNCSGFKNLLGTFFPPDNIYIDSSFFDTLSDKDFASGLGEIVKFSVIKKNGEDINNYIDSLLQRDRATLEKFVLNSLQLKKFYIEKDEFDRKERVLLNYAHTFGHAFEVTSDFLIPHGTAVALGMVVANRISANRYSLPEQLLKKIEAPVHRIVRLKLKPQWFEPTQILRAIRKDKKQLDSNINAVLLQDDLSLKRVNDVTEKEVLDALQYLIKTFEEADNE